MGSASGVYRAEDSNSGWALSVLDGAGVVRWSVLVDPWENPGVEGVVAGLDALAPELMPR